MQGVVCVMNLALTFAKMVVRAMAVAFADQASRDHCVTFVKAVTEKEMALNASPVVAMAMVVVTLVDLVVFATWASLPLVATVAVLGATARIASHVIAMRLVLSDAIWI